MPLMDTYKQFLELKQSGFKKLARQLADELIREYRNHPEPDFIYSICEECIYKIDFIIWNEIVLPNLKTDLEDNPRAIKAMICTIQNLYSSKSDWESLGYITDELLTIRLHQLQPNNAWAYHRRIEQSRKWLRHTIHEWPVGVLYGMNGATIEQCDEILDAVDELRQLDSVGDSNELCDDVERKTKEYKLRLTGKRE